MEEPSSSSINEAQPPEKQDIQSQELLQAAYETAIQLHHQLVMEHKTALDVGEHRLNQLTLSQERARTLEHDLATHREMVIKPLCENLLTLKAQALDKDRPGTWVVAHMELYRLELEVTKLLRMKKKKARYRVVQTRMMDLLHESAMHVENLKANMDRKMHSIHRLAMRGNIIAGYFVDGGKGDGGVELDKGTGKSGIAENGEEDREGKKDKDVPHKKGSARSDERDETMEPCCYCCGGAC